MSKRNIIFRLTHQSSLQRGCLASKTCKIAFTRNCPNTGFEHCILQLKRTLETQQSLHSAYINTAPKHNRTHLVYSRYSCRYMHTKHFCTCAVRTQNDRQKNQLSEETLETCWLGGLSHFWLHVINVETTHLRCDCGGFIVSRLTKVKERVRHPRGA